MSTIEQLSMTENLRESGGFKDEKERGRERLEIAKRQRRARFSTVSAEQIFDHFAFAAIRSRRLNHTGRRGGRK